MAKRRSAVAAFNDYLKGEQAADNEVIRLLFGTLPEWLPEPSRPRIQSAIAVLRNAKQVPVRILEAAAQAGRNELVVPGSARDVTAFIQAAYELAHFRWALSLSKADAIRELGGRLAAQSYQRSRAAQQARTGISESDRAGRNAYIRHRAQELMAENPSISSNKQGDRLGPEFGLSRRQIKRILQG